MAPSQRPAVEPGFSGGAVAQEETATPVAVGMKVQVEPEAPLAWWRYGHVAACNSFKDIC